MKPRTPDGAPVQRMLPSTATGAPVWTGGLHPRRAVLIADDVADDRSQPPVVALLTAHPAPPLAVALRARGIEVAIVDHPSTVLWTTVPDILIVDAESLASGEAGRLSGLFDELDQRGVRAILATSGLDRLDPAQVERRAREGQAGQREGVDRSPAPR